ncbi:MAG TPA: HAMP domain-containing sensor histidine kinase [Steroidobacteraceae bacterium]|nr:HAMP domain-containing sensor histidine kinase [Steroidobacteraceae bacterium]
MSRAHSLRIRLLGAMFAVFALGLGASLATYRWSVDNVIESLHEHTLENQAHELLEALQERPDGSVAVILQKKWRQVYADPSREFTYTVFDSGRRPISWSANLTRPLQFVPVSGDATLGPVELTGLGREQQAVVTGRAPHGATIQVARQHLDRDTLVDSLFEEESEHALILIPFALLGLGLIWMISGWSLRPIARASREAARVGPRRPDLRISPTGLPTEIRPLVEAVNGALDRLSRAYSAERRLTADAAHELRTPLAVLNLRLQRARLTGTIDWPVVERELSQMERLVNQLIDLARKEALSSERRAEELPAVNLSRLVREAAALVLPLIEAQGRRLEVDVPDAVQMRGRADDLRDMVRNLLDNALIHGRGTVTARVGAASENPALVAIEVRDEGTGVPLGQEESVFQRFHKLNAETTGSGLGLAIVRHVARTHGGDAHFLPGLGCVVVHLPVPASSPAEAPASV